MILWQIDTDISNREENLIIFKFETIAENSEKRDILLDDRNDEYQS